MGTQDQDQPVKKKRVYPKWSKDERAELRKKRLREEATLKWFKNNFGKFFPNSEICGANMRMRKVREALTYLSTLDPHQLRYAMECVKSQLAGRPFRVYKPSKKLRNAALDLEKMPTLYDPDEEA